MTVKTYNRSQGNLKLSENFSLLEFACHDSKYKEILVDEQLVNLLQKLRDHFQKTITITSGYRPKTYNIAVGGAPESQHIYGRAVDITIVNTHPREICKISEALGFNGVGCYDYGNGAGFAHVDTRSYKSYWEQLSVNGSQRALATHGGATTPIIIPSRVLDIDGKFQTESIKRLQGIMGSYVDGVISEPSSPIAKLVQGFLTNYVAPAHIEALTGKKALSIDGKMQEKTFKVLQFYLFNTQSSHYLSISKKKVIDLSLISGKLDVLTAKLWQIALNSAQLNSSVF